MSELRKSIDAYNTSAEELYGSDDDFYRLAQIAAATSQDLAALERHFGFPLPSELKSFYETHGGLKNVGNDEAHCFQIPSASGLVSKLESANSKYRSLGLTDVIVGSWGGDRADLVEAISKDDAAMINSTYKCIGWYRGQEMLEGATYVFCNSGGNFGELFYHQDDLESAVEGLLKLRRSGLPEKQTLDDVLVKAIAKIRQSMIDWG